MKRAHVFTSLVCIGVALSGAALSRASWAPRSAGAVDPLELVPADTGFVLGVNLSAARGTPVGDQLAAALSRATTDKLGDVVGDCGFDPVAQVEKTIVVVPEDLHGEHASLATILKGHFEPERLLACVHKQSAKEGKDVREIRVGDHPVFQIGTDGTEATCVDSTTCLLGSHAWITSSLALADHAPGARGLLGGKSGLAALLADTDRERGIWWAGMIPRAVADQIAAADPKTEARSLKDTHGAIDFRHGLDGTAFLGAPTPDEAQKMAREVSVALSKAQRDPDVIAAGLDHPLKRVTANAAGSQLALHAALTPQEFEDLTAKLKTLAAKTTAVARAQAARAPASASN